MKALKSGKTMSAFRNNNGSHKVIPYRRRHVGRHNVRPKDCKGRRNLYCEAYDACLDKAIQNNWRTFSCSSSCSFIRSYDPPDIVTNGPDHWELYDFYLW